MEEDRRFGCLDTQDRELSRLEYQAFKIVKKLPKISLCCKMSIGLVHLFRSEKSGLSHRKWQEVELKR